MSNEFFYSLPNMDMDTLQTVMNTVFDSAPDTSEHTPSDSEKGCYGCKHYLRRCKIVAPCCGRVCGCRLCHDEELCEIEDRMALDGTFISYTGDEVDKENIPHTIDRYSINTVICTNCGATQTPQQNCVECGVCMGIYYCAVCKLYADIDKGQFHCDKCGLCRTNREHVVHCDSCGLCMHKDHECHGVGINNCPICMESMFTTTKSVNIMRCGHYIHHDCFIKFLETSYKCPLCLKSIGDMDKLNELMDMEVANTPMPPECAIDIHILCNDCGTRTETKFHVVGHKCPACGGYNTRRL